MATEYARRRPEDRQDRHGGPAPAEGPPWQAQVGRLGRGGAMPEEHGFPIGRVACGYRLCNAHVAVVWPAVSAAPGEAGAGPEDGGPVLSGVELVGAGLRLAGPDEWPLVGRPSPAAVLAQRRHRIDFRPGIAPGADGVFALTRRAERAWQQAKRFRVPWPRFALLERRPRIPVGFERRPVRRVMTPGGPFRFRCPVCGRVNAAQVAAACPDDCRLHATDGPHFDSMLFGLWWWPTPILAGDGSLLLPGRSDTIDDDTIDDGLEQGIWGPPRPDRP